MTKEEAIKIINCYDIGFYDLSGEKIPADKLAEAFDMAIEALKERPKGEWIPCSERLPEQEEKSYWVCTNDGYQCQCRWTNINHIWTDLTTSWHWHVMDIPQHSKVVAWMPLPDPWKEGESNG